MEFCFEVVEATIPKLKRLKLKPQVLRPFLIDLVCCIMGLRNAYLVDGISIEMVTVWEICQVVYANMKTSASKSKSPSKIGPNVVWGEAVRGRVAEGGSGVSAAVPTRAGTLAPSKLLIMQLNEFDIIVCNLTVFYGSYRSLAALGLDRVAVDVTNGGLGGADPSYCGRVCCASERAVLASQLQLLFEPMLPTIEAAIYSPNEHVVLAAVMGGSVGGAVDSVLTMTAAAAPAGSAGALPLMSTRLPGRLSFAFLAGWLLNYACIYHFERVGGSGDVDSGPVACLCNQQLQKYALVCTRTCPGTPSVANKPVVLMEFTVPVGLLETDCDSKGELCSVESHIVGCVDQHVANIQALLGTDGGLSYSKEVVCQSCIVL